jgi:tetratricopeptide (TPR) repeat protein
MPKLNPLPRIQELTVTGVWKLFSKFELWLIKKSCLGNIEGIAVCDNSMVQQNRDNFLNLTRQAMALVQSTDSRRYRRVCRRIEFIVNMELISGGNFARKLKICRVDYSRLTSADPLWNLRQYAQLLVHEATHGLLFEKGIPYDKKTRERVERLCRLEEYRFARRIEPGWADIGVQPFNPEWYEMYWDDKARRVAEWKRLWEAIKASKKAEQNAKDGVPIRPIPMDAKAYNDRAESYRREGNNDKAISYFSHAIQLDPEFAHAYNNRGHAHHEEGRYDEAIKDYDRAIQLDSKFAWAYLNRGLTYRFKGEYDKAIADYSLAIQLDPEFARAYNNRGYAYHCKGEYDKAIADCDRAIQINPTYMTAYINRGRAHRTVGNYEKAIADYSRLIDLAPKNASAYNNLAWLLATCPNLTLRNGRKAVENATKACELAEWKNPSAVNTLALACAEVADFENAVKWLSRYLESPNLSANEVADAKRRLALYQTHLRGDHNRN